MSKYQFGIQPVMFSPASTCRMVPVMRRAPGEARKAAPAPTSSISTSSPRGERAGVLDQLVELLEPRRGARRHRSGEIACTRMPRGPSSAARYRTADSRAALIGPITL